MTAASAEKRIPALESPAAVRVDDQGEPGEGEHQREPDPSPHLLAKHHSRPDGDQHGRHVLNQQRDPDREPMDGEEVEPLDKRDPEHPERRQEHELARGARSREGARRATRSTSPTSAPVVRTCTRRSEEKPEASSTLETAPLSAQSVAAAEAIR